jgi:acetyl-CoA C-acetyltransferase
MSDIPANTPVLVGIGVVDQKLEDWRAAKEPVDLMIDAARAAVQDAGAAELGSLCQRVYVPRGLWQYSDPARLVASALGAPDATTVLVELGILQQTALGESCRLIAGGELEVAMVVGGEARYRHLRAQIAGEEAAERAQEEAPDITMALPNGVSAELYLEAELNAGLSYMPVNYYAIMESAFRASRGWSVEQHRDYMADLYSRFSDIAADNPHAWKPGHVDAATIRDPGPKNPMLAFPYTKLHNTSWNVDQASALLFCSAAKAESLGIPRERWIFPLASAECDQVLSVAQRRSLHRVPGVRAAAEAMFAACGCSLQEIDLLELYSCFPVAVESYAAEIGIDLDRDRDFTVTGGMPFAGGPLNNYVLQATCRMAQLLRQGRGRSGLVTSVSGLMTKQGIALWSTDPAPGGFRFIDVTESVVAGNPPLEVVAGHEGEATVAGYTVMYQGGERLRAVAMVDLPDGRRAVVWSEDPDVMAEMEQREYCGATVRCSADRFSLGRD